MHFHFSLLILFFATPLFGLNDPARGRPASAYIQGAARRVSNAQRRYIITGGPGVGKSTLIRQLQQLGQSVVHETAADLIREDLAKQVEAPWAQFGFNERVATMQAQRQREAANSSARAIFFDRCLIDVLCYELMEEWEPSKKILSLAQEMLDIGFYEPTVFLVDPLGTGYRSETQHESDEEAHRIGQYLERQYRLLGFDVVHIPSAPIEERVQHLIAHLPTLDGSREFSLATACQDAR